MDNDAPGKCLLYMVKDFSDLHAQNQLEQVKRHALKVALSTEQDCYASVYYFKDCAWTQENKNNISTDSMREMAEWDKGIHPVFPEMPNAFLCRVYFKCEGVAVSKPIVDKKFIYRE